MTQLPYLRHAGEKPFLDAVVQDLASDEPKLVYADWLEEHGDNRAAFLRAFVAASQSMNPADFPDAEELDEVDRPWQDLIGYDLLKLLAEENAGELKTRLLALARPALRLMAAEIDFDDEGAADDEIPVGGSKLFGRPDLPDVSFWPKGDDCKAIYNDSCEGIEGPAGFMAQVNLADLVDTQAGKLLPDTGLLSFFCYQDIDENVDAVGVCAKLLPEPSQLQRTDPPEELAEGNGIGAARKLSFIETLDLPSAWSGPWAEELTADTDADVKDLVDSYRDRNFENMLGYGRETSGDEPTPNKESRHLIVLDTSGECRMHIQIPAAELAARNFDAVTLEWVDFD